MQIDWDRCPDTSLDNKNNFRGSCQRGVVTLWRGADAETSMNDTNRTGDSFELVPRVGHPILTAKHHEA
jgi:hypothetical protein